MTENQDKVSALDKLFEAAPTAEGLSDEGASKDAFFIRLAEVAEEMVAKHGKEFAMGVLVLSARFIAEGKPLFKRNGGADTKLS